MDPNSQQKIDALVLQIKNFRQNLNALVIHIKIMLNSTKCSLDLAVHISARAIEMQNQAAMTELGFLINQEKYFFERLSLFNNQAIALQHTIPQLRDPQFALAEFQVKFRNFETDMIDFYASPAYQVAWDYLSEIKRAKQVFPAAQHQNQASIVIKEEEA